jgi:hypothetical protein
MPKRPVVAVKASTGDLQWLKIPTPQTTEDKVNSFKLLTFPTETPISTAISNDESEPKGKPLDTNHSP